MDQEMDIETYIHLFKHNKEWWLAVQRGKHRIPTILPDEFKYFLMKFPKSMPIPDNPVDENGEFIRQGYRKLPSMASNTSDDLFKF